jgi:hypothetical protein
MGGLNRGRYTVQLGGPWRLYTHALPGWRMLGTIQRNMEIGALALSQCGVYTQVNAGAVRALNQNKIATAIKSQS